ncbi:RecB family exonuclease [Halorientalis marina]|uniref:RecB family exonuclease n=1 Tax=Halorientalis marina TaxID=2931976 RepID=UPI001FF68A98|nr:PD-(D/E)XK nuclease family protein [Halorientalis marina]
MSSESTSDTDAGREHVSPSSLATYAYCPRQYDFAKAQRIDTVDDTKRYLQQGLAMHTTIEWTCEETSETDTPQEIHDRMHSHFPDAWAEEVDPDEFASDAQHDYYRRLAKAGLASVFDPADGAGIDHARQSVAVEKRLTCEHEGVPLKGYADNIIRTDDGLHVVDYKRNTRGMLTSGTAERLEQHLAGEEHEPGRVKNAMQTAAYIEGVKDTTFYEPGMDVQFTFYGLLNNRDIESSPDGYSVTASGYGREMTELYDEYYDTIWELIANAYEGIRGEQYEPEPRDLIYEEGCGDCRYQSMCPDYLGWEVEL